MGASKGAKLTTKNGMASGGAGTILVAIAEHLSPGHELVRQILIYAAPLATIGASMAWAWGAAQLAAFRQKVRIKKLCEAARLRRDNILDDLHSSEALKVAAREGYERMMNTLMDLERAEANELAISARRVE